MMMLDLAPYFSEFVGLPGTGLVANLEVNVWLSNLSSRRGLRFPGPNQRWAAAWGLDNNELVAIQQPSPQRPKPLLHSALTRTQCADH